MEVAEPVEEQGIEKSRLRTGAKRPPAVKAEGSGAQPTLLRPTNFEFAMEVGLAWRLASSAAISRWFGESRPRAAGLRRFQQQQPNHACPCARLGWGCGRSSIAANAKRHPQPRNLEQAFTRAPSEIDAIINFASLKAVGESVEQPIHCWNVKVSGSRCLLEATQTPWLPQPRVQQQRRPLWLYKRRNDP